MIKALLAVVLLCCFLLSVKYARGDYCDHSDDFLDNDAYEFIGNERVFSPEKAVKSRPDVQRAKLEYCLQQKNEQKEKSKSIVSHETKECSDFSKCNNPIIDSEKKGLDPDFSLEKLAPQLNLKK